MEKAEQSDEWIAEANEKQKVLLHQPPGIPGDHGDAGGDDYAEYLGQSVKKQVVATGQIVEQGSTSQKKQ